MKSGTATTVREGGTTTGPAQAVRAPPPAAHSPAAHPSATHLPATHAALAHAQVHAAAVHTAVLRAHAAAVQAAASAPSVSFVQKIQNWALQWEPVVGILFFVAIIAVMWRMLKVMPRIKPQQIKPASDQAIGWEDNAGRSGEHKYEI